MKRFVKKTRQNAAHPVASALGLPVHVEEGACPCGRLHGEAHLAACVVCPVECDVPRAAPPRCAPAPLDRCDASVWWRAPTDTVMAEGRAA